MGNKDNRNNLESVIQRQESVIKADANEGIEEPIKKEIGAGRSDPYATEYARLVDSYGNEVARKHVEIVDREFKSGKSYIYASRYATMIEDCKVKESIAREYARAYESC